jgi:hypothetical protein
MATKETQAPAAATTTTPSLAAKILAVKNAVGVIGKDSDAIVGGGKKINYASLTAILKVVTPILAENQLDYEITAVLNEHTLPLLASNFRVFALNFVDTVTGERTEPLMYPFRLANNPEAIKSDGSTITYAQRYLLGMALGLQTELDPDATFSNGNGGKKTQQAAPASAPTAAPAQPKYDFATAKNKLYAFYNEKKTDNAKAWYDYIVQNFSNDPRYMDDIAQMQLLNL